MHGAVGHIDRRAVGAPRLALTTATTRRRAAAATGRPSGAPADRFGSSRRNPLLGRLHVLLPAGQRPRLEHRGIGDAGRQQHGRGRGKYEPVGENEIGQAADDDRDGVGGQHGHTRCRKPGRDGDVAGQRDEPVESDEAQELRPAATRHSQRDRATSMRGARGSCAPPPSTRPAAVLTPTARPAPTSRWRTASWQAKPSAPTRAKTAVRDRVFMKASPGYAPGEARSAQDWVGG